MDRMKYFFIACFLLGLAATNIYSQDNVYSDKEAGFSIELPAGWVKIGTADFRPTPDFKSGKIYGFGTDKSRSSSFIYVGVLAMAQAKTLKDLAVGYLTNLSINDKFYRNTPLQDTKLNGVDCISTIVDSSSSKFDVAAGEEKILYNKSIYYFLTKGNTAYIVYTFSYEEDFEKEKPLLEGALSSFKIIE